jgi:hypothetical protein
MQHYLMDLVIILRISSGVVAAAIACASLSAGVGWVVVITIVMADYFGQVLPKKPLCWLIGFPHLKQKFL